MTSDPELAAAIDALMGTPLSIEDALRPPAESGLPDEPGLYAVWIHSSALAGLQAQPHPLDAEWRLLYLGIAPARATSSQLLRSRVVGNHLRGNTGASTLRLSLAALLMDELGLQPLQRRKKVVLSKTQNDALSAWQRDNLALTWAVRSEPWSVEHVVIADLSPPLNLDGNATHPYHPILSQARADFRATATARDSTWVSRSTRASSDSVATPSSALSNAFGPASRSRTRRPNSKASRPSEHCQRYPRLGAAGEGRLRTW